MYGFDCTLIGKLDSDICPVFKHGKMIAVDFYILVPRRDPFCNQQQFEKIKGTYTGKKMEYLVDHYGRGSLVRVQGEFFISGRYNKASRRKVLDISFHVYPEESSFQAIIITPPKIIKHMDELDSYIGYMDRYNAIIEEDEN